MRGPGGTSEDASVVDPHEVEVLFSTPTVVTDAELPLVDLTTYSQSPPSSTTPATYPPSMTSPVNASTVAIVMIAVILLAGHCAFNAGEWVGRH